MATVNARGDDAIGDLDAVGIVGELAAGRVSRSDVLEAAMTRIQQVDGILHAVELECFDRARITSDAAGPFSGVPGVLKDTADVAGLPTRCGSEALLPHPARTSSPPAKQFLAQGFTLVAKSTTPEFGLTASTESAERPSTRNPWDTSRTAGGSSSGSAALVASGAVPIAHGNDGGGSIRIPAASCGLVGLKPSRARLLDTPGIRQLPVVIVAEGVLTRTVRDTAHFHAAAEQWHPARPLPPIGLVEGPSDRRLRIGLVRNDLMGRTPHDEIDAILSSAATVLDGIGHDVIETRLVLDERLMDDFLRYWSLFAALACAAFRAAHRGHFRTDRLGPFTRGLLHKARQEAASMPGSIRRLRQVGRAYARVFNDVDVLMTPVVTHPSPQIGHFASDVPFDQHLERLRDWIGYTPLCNASGGPAIALPHGMMSNNLPGAVQLAAAQGDEATLLDVAYQLEAASPFPRLPEVHQDTPEESV